MSQRLNPLLNWPIASLLCLSLVSPTTWGLTREVTADELQTEVANHFPLVRELPLAIITLTNPSVVLREHSDRIGIRLTVSLAVLGDVVGKARGLIDGQLRYKAETGEFFLDHPEISELNVAGVEPEYQEEVRNLLKMMAQESLADLPIYELKKDDPQQVMARLFLNSVTVTNGKLILDLDI